MTGIAADVLEYLQATAAYEQALAEFGAAGQEAERIRVQWEPVMGTPEGAELASALGAAFRRAEQAGERCATVKARWETARARVDVVRVIEAMKAVAAEGHA